MIFIDLSNYRPSDEWLERAQAVKNLVSAEADFEGKLRIINNNSNLWTELKDDLRALSNNKCWYSEAADAYAHAHIDHFRPKGRIKEIDRTTRTGYWWLAFEYLNYRYCGGAGNVRKNDKFAVRRYPCLDERSPIGDEIIYLLDPCKISDVGFLNFIENGEVTYCSDLSEWNQKRVVYTIETLNLNFQLLIEERAKVWKKCYKLIKEAQEIASNEETEVSVHLQTLFAEKINQIAQLKDKSQPFSAVAQSCIYSSGLGWLKKI